MTGRGLVPRGHTGGQSHHGSQDRGSSFNIEKVLDANDYDDDEEGDFKIPDIVHLRRTHSTSLLSPLGLSLTASPRQTIAVPSDRSAATMEDTINVHTTVGVFSTHMDSLD